MKHKQQITRFLLPVGVLLTLLFVLRLPASFAQTQPIAETSILASPSQQANNAFVAGSGIFTDSGQNLGNSASYGVALGDLDGDGDLDAFVANRSNGAEANKVWLNQGGNQGGTSGVFSDSGQSLGLHSSYAIALGDVDGDNDLDAFVANNGQANKVWLNQGGDQAGISGVFSDSGQSLANSNSHAVVLGDVDGDGDLDAFIGNGVLSGQANKVWLNQGGIQGGTSGVFNDSGQSLGNSNTRAVALGDVDGDGDLDAFVANWNNEADEVWFNQGGIQGGILGQFADSSQTLGNFASVAVVLKDFDHDGDLDAFVASATTGSTIWVNQGGAQGGTTGVFSDSGQSLSGSNSWGVALGDLDNDGDFDAFVGNRDDEANKVWLNQGKSQGGTVGQFSDSGQSLGLNRSMAVALGDLDGDNDLDAFVANENQANKVWFNLNLTTKTEKKIAYVYQSDTTTASDFDTLLSDNGFTVQLIAQADVLATDFSPFDLVITAHDSGYLSNWGNEAGQVQQITNNEACVLGLGEGGYAFFGQLELHIGWAHGWHGNLKEVVVSNPGLPYFQSPNDLTELLDAPLTLYTVGVEEVGIYVPQAILDVTKFGIEPDSRTHAPLIDEWDDGNYYQLWGYAGGPSVMTAEGRSLFINAVSYAIDQCDSTAPPPIISVGSGTVAPTGTLFVPVEVEGLSPRQLLGAAEVKIWYDPDVFNATECQTNANRNFDLVACNIETPGTVLINAASTDGISKTARFVDITFRPVEQTRISTTTLEVDSSIFANPNGQPLPVRYQNGQIEIRRPQDANQPPSATGDVNCDGSANVLDTLFILQFDVGMRSRSQQCSLSSDTLYYPACDVNRDGTCGSTDALLVIRCATGFNNPLCPAETESPREGQPDVSRAKQEPAEVTFSIGSESMKVGESLLVPVMSTLSDATLAAATFEVEYDTTVLTVTGCEANSENSFDFGTCNIAHEREDGTKVIRFNVLSIAGISGNLPLAQIQFEAIGEGVSQLDLQLITADDLNGQSMTGSSTVQDGQLTIESAMQKIYLPVLQR